MTLTPHIIRIPDITEDDLGNIVLVDCDDKGNILKEKSLPRLPRGARFDEVWENDEGRTAV